jgi:hypothetical protein
VDRELPLCELPAGDRRAAHHLRRLPRRTLRLCLGRAGALSFLAGVTRTFCGRCGTPLTYEGERWPGEVHALIGSMDRPQDFAPSGDAFVEEKLPWLRLGKA